VIVYCRSPQSDSQIKFAFEIGALNLPGLLFGPLLQAHFFNQAQIKDLGIMGKPGSPVGIRMQVIAGEISAFITEAKAPGFNAFKDITGFLHPVKGNDTAFFSAAPAGSQVQGDAQVGGNLLFKVRILIGQHHGAIETIQTAGGGHLGNIHLSSW